MRRGPQRTPAARARVAPRAPCSSREQFSRRQAASAARHGIDEIRLRRPGRTGGERYSEERSTQSRDSRSCRQRRERPLDLRTADRRGCCRGPHRPAAGGGAPVTARADQAAGRALAATARTRAAPLRCRRPTRPAGSRPRRRDPVGQLPATASTTARAPDRPRPPPRAAAGSRRPRGSAGARAGAARDGRRDARSAAAA